MRKIIFKEDNGTEQSYVPEQDTELKQQLATYKKENFKEHLYMGYLIVGTLAFTLGIIISLKRLNGNK